MRLLSITLVSAGKTKWSSSKCMFLVWVTVALYHNNVTRNHCPNRSALAGHAFTNYVLILTKCYSFLSGAGGFFLSVCFIILNKMHVGLLFLQRGWHLVTDPRRWTQLMTNLENTNPHQGNSEYIQIWKWKKKERYLCSINRIKNVTVFPSSMLVLIVSNVAKTKTKQSFPITTVTTRPLHLGMWASDRVCVCVLRPLAREY